MINLDSMLKSRDITLPTKVCIVRAVVVFPVVMYGCESWTVKKAKCQRIAAFELWCWRRLLKVPWTTEIKSVNPNPEYLLKSLMLKLKLQYFSHLMRTLEKIEGRRRRENHRIRLLDDITNATDMNLGKLQERSRIEAWCAQPMGSQRVGCD